MHRLRNLRTPVLRELHRPKINELNGGIAMKRALINPENCLNCPECNVANFCPQKAIIRERPVDKPWVDFWLCRGCMKCKQLCVNDAILEESKPCNGDFSQSW